ncbi:hypothetical protein KKF34_03295 [Myxococcota bacterium]|nr:hypothetical protein [Myxococcota bacterium]MBU1380673.1 hypothetical protein [Myxococcota bacterium]MBU1495881.1 hypothetical protein [Myxococcota bacterium]
MKNILFLTILLGSFSFVSCVDKHSNEKDVVSFKVIFGDANGPVTPVCGNTEDDPCDFNLTEGSFSVPLSVRALNENLQTASTFGRTVLISVVPSGILDKDDPHAKVLPDGRLVLAVALNQGEWNGNINFRGAFGAVSIFVEDVGYEPAADVVNSACYNIYPGPGCYAQDDDNPLSGTGAVGVSNYLYFMNPTIYDIQKPADEDAVAEGIRDSDGSELNKFRIQVDAPEYTGDDGCPAGTARLVVTQVSVTGFYVTDVCNRDPESGDLSPNYASLYVYNFNTPEELYRGDCLLSFQGAVDEFQGYTELKNPFWTVDTCHEEDPGCDVDEPKCADLVPAPIELDDLDFGDPLTMERMESALVTIHNVTATTEFLRCDQNGDGVIDYDLASEKQCKYDCEDEVGCVVKEDYDVYFTWTVNLNNVEVGVVSKGIIGFDPEDEANLGQSIYKITGTLKHLDFGSPAWIIIPRDPEDFCLTQTGCEE